MKMQERIPNLMSFFDTVSSLDRELLLLSELLQAIADLEQVTIDSVNEAGYLMESYLNRKWAAECYFLKRREPRHLREDLFKWEMNRLKEAFGNQGQSLGRGNPG